MGEKILENEKLIEQMESLSMTPMSPLWMFVNIAKILHIKKIKVNTGYNSLVYIFDLFKTEATQEFLNKIFSVKNDDIKDVLKDVLKCNSEKMEISYIQSKKKNECLCMKVYKRDHLDLKTLNLNRNCDEDRISNSLIFNNSFDTRGRRCPNMEIHVYDGGIAWNYTKKKEDSKPKGFPCSMKDFFAYQEKENVQYEVFYSLFLTWGMVYPIWKDLAKDFQNGCIYASIPLKLIFSCNNRRELIQKRYGISFKRNNKENIGNGIFYARASRIIDKNELQKLFGFASCPYHIGRAKKDMIRPLSDYIVQNNFQTIDEEIEQREIRQLIQDGISMSINLKRMVPLRFDSVSGLERWHDELAKVLRKRSLPIVKIKKDSKFRKLKLPKDCVRLINRKMFVEEGEFQKNCVASYIEQVNNDICSIWSMRKVDGTRTTIEIRVHKGAFYIEQIRGFGNSVVAEEEVTKIKEYIEGQKPVMPVMDMKK